MRDHATLDGQCRTEQVPPRAGSEVCTGRLRGRAGGAAQRTLWGQLHSRMQSFV